MKNKGTDSIDRYQSRDPLLARSFRNSLDSKLSGGLGRLLLSESLFQARLTSLLSCGLVCLDKVDDDIYLFNYTFSQ